MSGNSVAPIPMSNYITPSYTFSPGLSGVGSIDLSGIDGFDIKRLVAIVNQTVGVIIYSSANSSCNYTNVQGTVVTLKFDTSTHSATDVLQIIYDTGYTRLDPVFPINIENCYVSNEVEIKNDEGNPVPVASNQSGTWDITNISGTISLPTGAATENNQTISNNLLSNLDSKTPALLNGRQPVEVLGMPAVARQLAAGPTSFDTALTVGVTRVSIYANGGSIRYSVGDSPQTASNSSHFIAMGERLDIIVPATGHIAVIRANSTNCTLEVTELV